MADSHYLAFDLGASSGRAVLGSFDGQRLKLEEVHRFPNGPVRVLDHIHWDVVGLFEQIRKGLAAGAARVKGLDGIGIDTWGVDFGLLSRDGQLLGLPYHYRDRRTQGMMEAAFARVPREQIYAQTGIQFMPLNTLYQLLSVAANDPALLDAADTLLFMPDLLNYWLTGVRQSEFSIASTSQLYDSAGNAWAGPLFDKLGLPLRIMPRVVPPGTAIGGLLPDIAEGTGLKPVQVIAPACHDTAAAVAAVPASGEGWAYISSGTWSLVGVELPSPIRTPEALAANFTNEGGVAGTIRFLKNVAGLWLVQECQRTWEAQGRPISHDELAKMAEAAPPHVCFVDPDDPCFAEPGDMPQRIREYCLASGQPVPQTQGEVVRCALESLALKYRMVVRQIEQLTGRPIEVLHVVGGGVRNELLCRLTADATGKLVIAGPAEATAAGNVMVQAMARGRVSGLDEIRQVVARSTPLRCYEPAARQEWADASGRFEALRKRGHH